MGQNIKQSIHRYYEERAREYDEIYAGGGPASISDPELYVRETEAVARLIPQHVGARHIDLACGTGYWLAHYHHKCTHITLVDQSRAVLAECRKKIDNCNVKCLIEILHADLFHCPLPLNGYDSALAGFIISHFDEIEEEQFFGLLKDIIKPGGRFVILDSSWTEERARARDKKGLQTRTLSDGREFAILKKYFDRNDFAGLGQRYGAEMEVLFEGRAFILASGRFKESEK